MGEEDFRQAQCARCNKSIEFFGVKSLGERSGGGVDWVLSKGFQEGWKMAFECASCGAEYCWDCAEYEPVKVEGKIRTFDYCIRCECGSTQFIPKPAMSNENKAADGLMAMGEGEKYFNQGDPISAEREFRKALDIANKLQDTDPFAKSFIARCNTGLAAVLSQQNKCQAIIEYADKALAFYDQYGHAYSQEMSKWIMAVFNKGAALAKLGKAREALEYFERSKAMTNEHGDNSPENKIWMENLENNIAVVKSML